MNLEQHSSTMRKDNGTFFRYDANFNLVEKPSDRSDVNLKLNARPLKMKVSDLITILNMNH